MIVMTLAELQTLCETDRKACNLYIMGVSEGIMLSAGVSKDATHFCVPDDVSELELSEVVLRYARMDLAAYPADKSLAAGGFIAHPR